MSHILFQTCICLNTFKGKHEFLREKKLSLVVSSYHGIFSEDPELETA